MLTYDSGPCNREFYEESLTAIISELFISDCQIIMILNKKSIDAKLGNKCELTKLQAMFGLHTFG